MSLANLDINSARIMARTISRRIGTKAVFGGTIETAESYLTPMQYRLKLYLAMFENDFAWDKSSGDMNPRKIDEIQSALIAAGTDGVWYLPSMSDAQCEQARINLMALKVAA